MSRQKKNYMFDSEVPLTKYKVSQIKKRTAEDASKQTEAEREIDHYMDEMDINETDLSNLLQQQCIEVENDVTFDDPLSDVSSNLLDRQTIEDETNNEYSYEELYSSNEDLLTHLEREIESSRSVELLQEKKFFESISLNISRSPAELLLLALKFALSSKLSFTALNNVLKLVNLVCGTTILPETRYAINKICATADNVTFHSICPVCSNYMGTFEGRTEPKICEHCSARVNASNPSDPCFFASIDPSEAISNVLKTHEEYYDYVVKERQHQHNHIKDIYDGYLYRQFVQNLPECDRQSYATVVFNTDGAPVFKSSKFSLWPIYIILNEIPVQNRMDSAITVGLWCGNSKPEMSAVLDIFVKVMNNLSTIGINCTIKNDRRRIKIYALLAAVDTQARPEMNGSSHFNANFGCDWCLHEGHYFAGSMRYPFKYPLPLEQDHHSTIEHATEAVTCGRRVFGIVSASPHLNLQNFDIIEGFTPDYMHCCLAGVTKQFTDLILGHLTKTQIEYINVLLTNIRAPSQIGRLSRSLEYKGYWKAREYENWALYYSVPILSMVMENNTILKHWCLFVDALHICLQMDITYSELNHANQLLHEFVEKSQVIYSLSALTYNVHQLLHLAKSIYNWGPIFAHSTFPFESANHNLLTAIHCAKGVILQIIKYENLQRCVRNLENQLYQNCPTNVIDYCEQLGGARAKHFYKISGVTYLGIEKIIKDEYVQTFNISRTAKVFNKIVFQGILYMSSHKQNKRSCNYFAQLNDKRFVELINFVIDVNNQEKTICKIIQVKQHKYSSAMFHVVNISEAVTIETKTICRSCVFIEIEKQAFIIPVPNTLHY